MPPVVVAVDDLDGIISDHLTSGFQITLLWMQRESKTLSRNYHLETVKVVGNEEEIGDLCERVSVGGKDVTPPTYGDGYGGGQMKELPDGTRIRLREGSSSGGPTIDIKYPDGTDGKVHIR